MKRFVLMLVVIFTSWVWTAMVLVGRDSDAATNSGARNVAATDPSGGDVAAEYERAPVTLDGALLFQVRGLPAYPAKERAQAISKRIEAIAADDTVAAGSLRVVEMEDRTRIMAGRRPRGGLCRCRCRGGRCFPTVIGGKGTDKNRGGDRFLPQCAQPACPALQHVVRTRRDGAIGDRATRHSRRVPQARWARRAPPQVPDRSLGSPVAPAGSGAATEDSGE